LQLSERIRLTNVHAKTTAAAESIRILSCCDVTADKCRVDQKTTSEAGGFIIGDASRDVTLDGCRVERALQAIEIGDDYNATDGITRDIRVANCRLAWCGQVEIAEGARYVSIDGNEMDCDISPSVASTAAILVGGADVRIDNNTIRHPRERP